MILERRLHSALHRSTALAALSIRSIQAFVSERHVIKCVCMLSSSRLSKLFSQMPQTNSKHSSISLGGLTTKMLRHGLAILYQALTVQRNALSAAEVALR